MQEKIINVVKIACYLGIAFSFVRTYFVCKTYLLFTKHIRFPIYKKEVESAYVSEISYAFLILVVSIVVLYIVS